MKRLLTVESDSSRWYFEEMSLLRTILNAAKASKQISHVGSSDGTGSNGDSVETAGHRFKSEPFPSALSRREKFLTQIRPASQRGLEIGALDRPVISRQEGRIEYVDWTSTEELRKARATDPTVNLENLVPVDYVWGQKTLRECIGPTTCVDYVLASHVVEHVPDLIGWFQEIEEVLLPGGILSLAVPDKRYTFDRLRPNTTVQDTVGAFLERRRKPSFRQIFEHFSLHTRIDAQAAWDGPINEGLLPRIHDNRYALDVCLEARTSDRYVDTHCWVFTPSTFIALASALKTINLVELDIVNFFTTERNEIDFLVSFQKPRRDPSGQSHSAS